MIQLTIPRIALVLSLLIPLAGLAADDDVSWIADKNGCKVANPFPQPGETITWDGKCKNGVADGEGLLQWYINGKLADRYEGTLKEGWAEGKGTLTRAEGGRYAGTWKHSLQDGDGRYDAPDGSWYEGQWKEGQPMATAVSHSGWPHRRRGMGGRRVRRRYGFRRQSKQDLIWTQTKG
jgi:hypothetical protein